MGQIRLHANENWFNPLSEIKDTLIERLSGIDLHVYPDPDAKRLKKELSDYTGVSEAELICTNGSDELIKIIFECYSKAGDSIVIHSPTFIEYTVMSEIRGCKTCAVDPNDDLSPNIDEIINTSIRENASITFICNPNNPTGYLFSTREINRIIDSVPGIVVVDEAYVEFSQVSLLGKEYNKDKVVIMRTLSKAFGAAALRVGYGIAAPKMIKKMNKVKMPFNLSTVSQESAIVLLENKERLTQIVKNIRRERMRIYGALSALQENTGRIEVFPSFGNYILIRSNLTTDIYTALTDEGFIVRNFTHDKNLENCIRFAITQPNVNSQVVDIIRKVVSA